MSLSHSFTQQFTSKEKLWPSKARIVYLKFQRNLNIRGTKILLWLKNRQCKKRHWTIENTHDNNQMIGIYDSKNACVIKHYPTVVSRCPNTQFNLQKSLLHLAQSGGLYKIIMMQVSFYFIILFYYHFHYINSIFFHFILNFYLYITFL